MYSFKLKNGMKVILIPRNTKNLVYFSIVMKNGKIDETLNTLSYTHAFEHLLAQFTSEKYPNYDKVKKELGYLGVNSNAYTDIYTTGYWILGNNKHLELYIDLLSNAYFHFKFSGDWEKQKNIVMEEIKMRSTNIWNSLDEKIDKIIFPSGHRLGIGWEEELKNIESASINKVIQFNLPKLNPKYTTLLVEGNFNPKTAIILLKKYFDKINTNTSTSTNGFNLYELNIPSVKKSYKGPKIILHPISNTNIAKIVYTFLIDKISRFDWKKSATIFMMMIYFCSGYYSKLFQVLREKHGLIYGLTSNFDISPVPQDIPGIFKIEIQVDPSHIKKVLRIVKNEIKQLKYDPIDNHELNRLKNKLKYIKNMEELIHPPGKYAEYYVTNNVWDRKIETFKDYFSLLSKITLEDIQNMAKQIFESKNLLLAIGGKIKSN